MSCYTHQRREYQLSAKLIVPSQIFVNGTIQEDVYVHVDVDVYSLQVSRCHPISVGLQSAVDGSTANVKDSATEIEKLSLCSF